jgi:hypothetical protein
MTPPPSLAHYKLASKLGEGGIGAVFRATDTKLNREAQVLASPNHPNIDSLAHGVAQ